MQSVKVVPMVATGCEQTVAHAANETYLVKAMIGVSDAAGAGREIERRGYGRHAANQFRPIVLQFAGKFEGDVSAERKAGHDGGVAAFEAQFAQHREQIRRQSRVVQGTT